MVVRLKRFEPPVSAALKGDPRRGVDLQFVILSRRQNLSFIIFTHLTMSPVWSLPSSEFEERRYVAIPVNTLGRMPSLETGCEK